jgi:predicted ATPase/DNA-binding CsgD family transcriptional regulator
MGDEGRPASPLNNLPAQVTSFVGREGELAAVDALVERSRLVTLTGAGGSGKTRLGLRVAAGLAAGVKDGVWFADLAPLADPGLVPVAVADVLEIRRVPGRPALDALVDAIGERSLLILLDNCEHVLDACAKLADALLRGCPNLTLLATSREPLRIGGERLYRVPSLEVPADGAGAGGIRAAEAVRLLEDRAAAQGVRLTWDEQAARVAARICRRLDGIPLAIELAAARLRMMSAGELDARLDERFALLTGGSRAALPRQRTLRAMVEWSWDLLTSPERRVLSCLSVFAGGFGLAAAETVAAGPDVSPADVASHLGALVDKSLVQFGDADGGPGRYRLLETVRRYAASRLDELGPAATDNARVAHRDYYLALAETAAPLLVSADQAEWLNRLDAELGNLRAAMAFSLSLPDLEPGLRLAASLRLFWKVRGHAAEGVEVLRALLDAAGDHLETLPRARAIAAATHLLQQVGAYGIAADYCEKALVIARTSGDDYLVADLLCEQAWLLVRQGQPGAALPLIEQGLVLARRFGEPHLTARLLSARAHATNVAGDPAGAAPDNAEALRLVRGAGDHLQAATLLCNLSDYELWTGDLDAARRHLTEALDIARAFNARHSTVIGTFNLGLAEYLDGSTAAAAALFAESFDLARRIGMKRHTAYAVLGLALASPAGAGPGCSARLHGAADQALADLGHTLQPLERRLADRDRQRLRAAMGADAFAAEYAAGRQLDPVQVLALFASAGTAVEQAPVAEQAPGAEQAPAAGAGEATSVLTARELDVLTLLARGLSNRDIARELVISEHTVHRHQANIYRKLGFSSRTAAVAWCARAGLAGA